MVVLQKRSLQELNKYYCVYVSLKCPSSHLKVTKYTTLLDAAVRWLRPIPVAARTLFACRRSQDWSAREAAGPIYDLLLLLDEQRER